MCFREQGDCDNAIRYALKAHTLATLFFSKPKRAKSPLVQIRIKNIEGVLSSVYEKANQLDSAIKYGENAYEVRKDWSGVLYVPDNA